MFGDDLANAPRGRLWLRIRTEAPKPNERRPEFGRKRVPNNTWVLAQPVGERLMKVVIRANEFARETFGPPRRIDPDCTRKFALDRRYVSYDRRAECAHDRSLVVEHWEWTSRVQNQLRTLS